jgi:hypothetical protein
MLTFPAEVGISKTTMATQTLSLPVSSKQPLIAIPFEHKGQLVVRYFTSEQEARAAVPNAVKRAIALAGVWSDLDSDEVLGELDRIRQESKPTPPVDDL